MLRTALTIAIGLALSAGIYNVYAEDQATSETTAPAVPDDQTKEKVSDLEGKLNGLEESYLENMSTLKKLAKLKTSGYIQAQFAVAETLGVGTSVAGAKFDKGTQSRFFVRRGRIKFNYDNGLSQYVLQFDASHGGFEIKDAYMSFTEPWLKNFTGTIGIFDRPFGYEISYSSSMRESPERSRMYQVLFPKEREVGAKLAFESPDGPLSFLNIRGGVFNGVTPQVLENNAIKDVIGRIGFEIPLRDIGMAIDGGFSAYRGKVTNTDTTAGATTTSRRYDTSWTAKPVVDADGNVTSWTTSRKVDSTITVTGSNFGTAYEMDGTKFKKLTGQKDADFARNYYGFDLQYYLDIPVIGGLTLRAEYLWGVQPGTGSSSSFYLPSAGQAPNGPVYSRNFNGWYLYWVQCWGSRVQSVLKYDLYDPNIDVKDNDIGVKDSKTGSADLSYSTLGLGLVYHWDDNLKFMFYYDMPKNEKSSNLKNSDPYKDFSRDLPDNVFTLRLQYKF